MAPKLSSLKFKPMKMINLWLFMIILLCLTQQTTSVPATGCCRPTCYFYTSKNVTDRPIKINMSGKSSGTTTTFCFNGLDKSMIYLWSNPMLKIIRNEASVNDSSKFVTYFGTSMEDVKKRSEQPGYAIVQSVMSSMRSLRQNHEDFSLSAFNLSCLAIDTNIDYTAKMEIKVAYVWFLAYLIIGITIFFSAKTWSSNTTLHYGTGISVGVVASLLILVFILMKVLPSRLKNIGYLLAVIGTSTSLWMFSTISHYFSNGVQETVEEYWKYIVGYCIVTGTLSFALVYRYGPVTDLRALNLIQWSIQAVGLVLVYNSMQIQEVAVAVVIVLLVLYNFPWGIFTYNQTLRNIWQRFFPPKIKLLTEDEYIMQGNKETKNELEKLRDYCRSPDCKAWKVITKLKSPHRFADFVDRGTWHINNDELVQHEYGHDSDNEAPSDTEFADFVEGNSWHLTNEELLEYDSDPDPDIPHNEYYEDDEEAEMDFQLSSP